MPPTIFASSDDMAARVGTTFGQLRRDPTAVGLELALEFMRVLRPETATVAALERQLAAQYLSDRRNAGYRWLGFLDAQPSDDRKFEKSIDALDKGFEQYSAALANAARASGGDKERAWGVAVERLEDVGKLVGSACKALRQRQRFAVT